MVVISQETMQASNVLKQSPIESLRLLKLLETPTSIIIEGTLPSYYLKQLAQETVIPVLFGRQLVNRVLVDSIER